MDALQATLQGERTEYERRLQQVEVRLEEEKTTREQAEAREKAEAEAERAANPVCIIERLLAVARIAGSALTALTAALAIYIPDWPKGFADLHLLTRIVPAAVVVFTFLSDLPIRRRVRR